MPNFKSILFECQGPVALLTLNRPQRANSLTQRALDEIESALDDVEADAQIRALVVTGAGKHFCSGFDLNEDAAVGEGESAWRPVLQRDFEVTMRFWHLSKPTIAAVHGAAVGGGCSIALACDLTIASESCRLGEPELKFGSSSPCLLMPWLINPKQAKELLLCGNDRIDAQLALRLGLINRIVPEGDDVRVAMEIARDLARMDPDALRLTKRTINHSYEAAGMLPALQHALDTAVAIESLSTPDRQAFKAIMLTEGLHAALAWREARFSGAQVSPHT